MRIFRTAVMAAFLAGLIGPVLAQDHVQGYREEDKPKTPEQIQSEKDADRAYRRSLSNIPDQAAPDPWGGARSANTATAAAATSKAAAKPKRPMKPAETGSNTN